MNVDFRRAPYVAIQLDTRPDPELDGEWTVEHFAMLERHGKHGQPRRKRPPASEM